MTFYGHTSEGPLRFPMECVNGYNPTHGFPGTGEALQTYQNAWPGLVEQIKEGLKQPMKELQDEVVKLRGELSRIKETVDQQGTKDDGKAEGKKAKLPKILSVSIKRTANTVTIQI